MALTPHNAMQLTTVMMDLLQDLQPLACRIILSFAEAGDFIRTMLEAQLTAARAIRTLCSEGSKASKYLEIVEAVTRASLEDRRRLDAQEVRATVIYTDVEELKQEHSTYFTEDSRGFQNATKPPCECERYHTRVTDGDEDSQEDHSHSHLHFQHTR